MSDLTYCDDHDDEYRLVVNLLRKLRREQGVSQSELASRLGKTQPFVSKYERLERRLDIVESRHILAALGKSLSEFAEHYERLLRAARKENRDSGH